VLTRLRINPWSRMRWAERAVPPTRACAQADRCRPRWWPASFVQDNRLTRARAKPAAFLFLAGQCHVRGIGGEDRLLGPGLGQRRRPGRKAGHCARSRKAAPIVEPRRAPPEGFREGSWLDCATTRANRLSLARGHWRPRNQARPHRGRRDNIRRVIEAILRRDGYDVVTAANGEKPWRG